MSVCVCVYVNMDIWDNTYKLRYLKVWNFFLHGKKKNDWKWSSFWKMNVTNEWVKYVMKQFIVYLTDEQFLASYMPINMSINMHMFSYIM